MLFTTLLLISCSSEDDDSTQNFLEKFNGVYWASNENDAGDFWLQFNLTNFVQCDDDGVDRCFCDSVTWGGMIDVNTTVSVKENGVEKLVINYSAQIDGTTFSFDLNIETINDGRGIKVLIPAGFENENETTETFTRFDSQPCN